MSLVRIAIAAVVLGSVATAASAADPPILPFEAVRTGMKGTGRTVFQGTTIESFDVDLYVAVVIDLHPGDSGQAVGEDPLVR